MGRGRGGGFPVVELPAAGSPSTASVNLSGTASYDAVPNPAGALVYSASASRPVRGAVVEIVNGASVIATTTTDANGAYSVTVPSGTSIAVRVKAQLLQVGSGPAWDVSVRDNTQSDAIYSMETPVFSSGTAAIVRDVHAPSGWDGTAYSATRVAAPFSILDTVYTTQAKVLSVAPMAIFPPLRLFWSVNNLPASGDPSLGQIGSTFFTAGDPSGRAIYVLGKADVDTDEYDASVIAHEWGHYYQSVFSRDDSPGGSHSLTDRLDRRVAFSEGWGNAWSGISLERSNYTDSAGPGQVQGANLDLTAGVTSNPGWFREASIHSILWRLNSQIGFKPIHDTLTGPFKSGVALTSIHSFTAAFDAAAPGSASALASLLVGQSISAATSDPFGNAETNNGGIALALPMYRQATVGGNTTACVSNLAGAGNKLGNFAYLRFNLPAAANHMITVAGPLASDPDVTVYSGHPIAQSEGPGPTESALVNLPAGTSVLAINDFNNASANTCFTVTIQ
ncbi:hypothetical protein E5CHR_01936 [Variovorax sp. PBL-E5]|nr:hypothetical protein E5CHR_01936 [Variovorax sp. PBL-E5]